MYIAAIDLGTTGVRAVVYGDALESLGEFYTEYPLISRPGGVVEQDAGLWWSLSCRAVRSAVASAGIPAVAVEALAVSSQGISILPVDKSLAPLQYAISWLDQRAERELERILGRYSRDFLFALTGKRATSGYTFPKIMWLYANRAETMASCHALLLPHDYLVARMTGRVVTDHTLASGTMLYDLERQDWSDTLLEAFGISRQVLPPLAWGGDAAGALLPRAARELGLRAGIPVAVGGQDQKCAAMAAGLRPGVATVSLGTAAAVTTPLAAMGREAQIPRFSFFSPGERVSEGVVNTAGMALRWLRNCLFPERSYAWLDEEADKARGKGQALFLPHLSGAGSPAWREGATGQFLGLTLDTGPGELIAAVMEGVSFELRRNLEAMGGAEAIHIFGGGARSRFWCQLLADISGRPVEQGANPEMACLGAGMLAAKAAGFTFSREKPADRAHFTPEPSLSSHYNAKYQAYLQADSSRT